MKGKRIMQVVIRTRREQTLIFWNELLEKAKKRLEHSKKCYELFGDEDSKRWIAEDEKSINVIEENMKKAIAFMDEHGIE